MSKHPPECKCNGAGWVWWFELDHYDGPATETGCDDTRYSCDSSEEDWEEGEHEEGLS